MPCVRAGSCACGSGQCHTPSLRLMLLNCAAPLLPGLLTQAIRRGRPCQRIRPLRSRSRWRVPDSLSECWQAKRKKMPSEMIKYHDWALSLRRRHSFPLELYSRSLDHSQHSLTTASVSARQSEKYSVLAWEALPVAATPHSYCNYMDTFSVDPVRARLCALLLCALSNAAPGPKQPIPNQARVIS